MSEKTEETVIETTDSDSVSAKKGSMMTYIIVGVASLALTVGVMTALVSGPSGSVSESEHSEESGAEADESSTATDVEKSKNSQLPDIFEELDNLSFLEDESVVDEAADNAASLSRILADEDTKGGSVTGDNSSTKMTKEDSVKASDWLETEKKKLADERREIEKLQKKMDIQERTLKQLLRQVDQAEAARLNGLAKLYDGMKPNQVARMIVKLDDKLIVSIMPRMKPAHASKILGLLPADRGALISRKMITLSVKK